MKKSVHVKSYTKKDGTKVKPFPKHVDDGMPEWGSGEVEKTNLLDG